MPIGSILAELRVLPPNGRESFRLLQQRRQLPIIEAVSRFRCNFTRSWCCVVAFNNHPDAVTRRQVAFVEELINPEQKLWEGDERKWQLMLFVDAVIENVKSIDERCPKRQTYKTLSAMESLGKAMRKYAEYHHLQNCVVSLATESEGRAAQKSKAWLELQAGTEHRF